MQRFTHIAVTVPRSSFEPAAQSEMLAFYDEVFGWTLNPGLSISGERIYLRAPTDDQYLTIRASDEPMRTSGYEHLGVEMESEQAVRELHERARKWSERDARVVLGEPKSLYSGHLLMFRVQYVLPISIEVQFLFREGEA